ncbi:MAG: ATP-binding cassette domain-containing protein [Bacteroidetes bacterium]|nr:ATP-binding cassette domain-containing protein [Bacteroidota bacterium]
MLQIDRIRPTYFDPSTCERSEVWLQRIEVEPGERIQIQAPSGSGKTSLTHFLFGLRKEYVGSVRYEEVDLRSMNPDTLADLRREKLAIVFQDMRLFTEPTLRANFEIKRQLTDHHPESLIDEWARRLGIDHRLDTPAKLCSYGEQQRASVIRALLQPFRWLLLDEPFSHLDDANARKAMDLILEESDRQGAALLLSDLEIVPHYPRTRLLRLQA